MEKLLYRCTKQELVVRLKNLKKIIEIFDSNLNDYEKVYRIISIYPTAKKFSSAYTFILKYGKDDIRFNSYFPKIIEIGKKLQEWEDAGIYGCAKYVSKMEDRFTFYDYAKFVIEQYVNGESYNTRLFLASIGIDDSVLNYCAKVIEELDVDLYNAYLIKREENKFKRYEANVYAFKSIAHGIVTGYTLSNEPFDVLTFWKLVPFKFSEGLEKEFNEMESINPNVEISPASNFINKVMSFIHGATPELENIIYAYMINNGITKYQYVSEEQLKTMYKGSKVTVNGKEIDTENEFKYIIKYLRINNYPLLTQTIKIVREKIRNGEIKTDELDSITRINDKNYYIIPAKRGKEK